MSFQVTPAHYVLRRRCKALSLNTALRLGEQVQMIRKRIMLCGDYLGQQTFSTLDWEIGIGAWVERMRLPKMRFAR